MPAVLLLNDGQACLLLGRQGEGEALTLDVVLPGPQPVQRSMPAAELNARYGGVVLVATPQPQAKDTSGEHSDSRLHWLWGTMRRFVPYYRSAMIAALLSNALMLVTGVITSVIYDKVIPHQAMVTLWALAGVGALAVVFDLAARQLRCLLYTSPSPRD